VVFEPVNQISRARNAGAAVADGDWLLFIDADSRLHPATLREMLATIDRGGCAGGGCLIGLEPIPWTARGLVTVWNLLSRSMKWAAGSFVFCRADAFRDLEGFSLELYAAEELDFSRRLKRWARRRGLQFIILKDRRHVSSGRKLQLYGQWEVLLFVCRSLLRFRHTVRRPDRLAYFYEGRRESKPVTPE
jgi:glycosyltransferase involved in cell wall biosynthesis